MTINERSSLAMVMAFAVASVTNAQLADLRITEVDPDADQVEVTNTGAGAFVTSTGRPFCHRFNYFSEVPVSTNFAAAGVGVFTADALRDDDSDLWLYISNPFTSGSNMIHGVKYGPAPNIGRAGLASGPTVGLWTGADQFAPAPLAGETLAWDLFGFSPRDWYIDETPSMGAADSTVPSTVASQILAPGGTQTFEDALLGDEVFAITDWPLVDSGSVDGDYTVRIVDDVLGVRAPRVVGSSRWLRIRDQDDADVQNRFYSTAVDADDVADYRWTFFVNLEETPPGGAATKPRLVIQHADGGFANAWGVEFTDAGANLVVTGVGGPAASAALYTLRSPTALGDWVKIELTIEFSSNTLSARINDAPTASLPIDLSATADKTRFRLCYRGEGAGNINTMLLDDVSIALAPACPADFTGDGAVGPDDLGQLLGAWGTPNADLTGDADTGADDLGQLLGSWGACPGF